MKVSKTDIRIALQPLRECMFVNNSETTVIFAIANVFNELVSIHGYHRVKNAVILFADEYKEKDIANKILYFTAAINKILENPACKKPDLKHSGVATKFIETYQGWAFSKEVHLMIEFELNNKKEVTYDELEEARKWNNAESLLLIKKQYPDIDESVLSAIEESWEEHWLNENSHSPTKVFLPEYLKKLNENQQWNK